MDLREAVELAAAVAGAAVVLAYPDFRLERLLLSLAGAGLTAAVLSYTLHPHAPGHTPLESPQVRTDA